jgi:hypothetical protein
MKRKKKVADLEEVDHGQENERKPYADTTR